MKAPLRTTEETPICLHVTWGFHLHPGAGFTRICLSLVPKASIVMTWVEAGEVVRGLLLTRSHWGISAPTWSGDASRWRETCGGHFKDMAGGHLMGRAHKDYDLVGLLECQAPPLSPPYLRAPRFQILKLLAGKIVVGHAIHNDFKALQYFHPKSLTRDTSHIPALNRKADCPENATVSLKQLTKKLLNRDIQVVWPQPPCAERHRRAAGMGPLGGGPGGLPVSTGR